MEKAKLTILPVTGEELEKMIGDLFKLEPALVAKLKASSRAERPRAEARAARSPHRIISAGSGPRAASARS